MDAAKASNRILFVDTDALTTLFYAKILLQDKEEISRCERLAEAINDTNDWDLILFLEPTVDFVQDGTRNEKIAADRQRYSDEIKALLDKYGIAYYTIGEPYYLWRFVHAKTCISHYLKIDTKW